MWMETCDEQCCNEIYYTLLIAFPLLLPVEINCTSTYITVALLDVYTPLLMVYKNNIPTHKISLDQHNTMVYK